MARGAVPQRLPGSRSCLCVTSVRLAGEAAADASNTVHSALANKEVRRGTHYLAQASNFPRKSEDVMTVARLRFRRVHRTNTH